MLVELECGRGRLPIEMPNDAPIVAGRQIPPPANERDSVRRALRSRSASVDLLGA